MKPEDKFKWEKGDTVIVDRSEETDEQEEQEEQQSSEGTTP